MKIPKFESHEIITVLWRDAHHDFESDSGRMQFDDYIVTTVGHYLAHDATWLHMAMEILPESSGYRGASHIPVTLIQDIKGANL